MIAVRFCETCRSVQGAAAYCELCGRNTDVRYLADMDQKQVLDRFAEVPDMTLGSYWRKGPDESLRKAVKAEMYRRDMIEARKATAARQAQAAQSEDDAASERMG